MHTNLQVGMHCVGGGLDFEGGFEVGDEFLGGLAVGRFGVDAQQRLGAGEAAGDPPAVVGQVDFHTAGAIDGDDLHPAQFVGLVVGERLGDGLALLVGDGQILAIVGVFADEVVQFAQQLGRRFAALRHMVQTIGPTLARRSNV